jgi:acetyltransferase
MRNFFNPKSIAIVGASGKRGKVGSSLVQNLKGFKGRVYYVNIKRKKILGKKCYKSVLDIKDKIDLGIIAIPSVGVYKALEECGKGGIKSVIIISAGFSEVGNKRLEKKILDVAEKYKIRILGPNTFGVVNPYINLDTTFAKTRVKKGGISFISQSGALWSAIADYSVKENFGFSKFASLGNMSDVSFEDLILYLNKDELTRVIVLYIELLENGRKFMDAAKKCKKPVIAIKAGRSEAGMKAALSHTGSLAGSYEIYKAAFKQSGVKLVDTLTEAFDLARFLEKDKIKGNRVVIVTNAGGPGALMADYCDESGLKVVKLPKKFVKDLKLPEAWSHGNPIDLVGDAKSDRFKEVFDKLSKENFYDILICILTPQNMTDIDNIAKELIRFKKKGRNIIACFMGGYSVDKAKDLLERNDILCFNELEKVVGVLKD